MAADDNILRNLDDRRIVSAIREAERNTSGEIKVHIEGHCSTGIIARSCFVFDKLQLDKTKQRNGVLFYLAYKDKKFAILGDKGINDVVDEHFWDDIKNEMATFFKRGDFDDGLIHGILACGMKLKEYFPHLQDDENEISDEISHGDD